MQQNLEPLEFFSFFISNYNIYLGQTSDVQDAQQEPEQQQTTSNYIGSFFSNAWSKTAQTANNAMATTSSGSSFLSSAFGKVTSGSTNPSAGKENVKLFSL